MTSLVDMGSKNYRWDVAVKFVNDLRCYYKSGLISDSFQNPNEVL